MGSARIIVILILLVPIMILIAGCILPDSDYPKFLSVSHDFTLEIQTNKPLQNATFYLPLPVENNRPMVGSRLLSPDDFKRTGYSIAFTQTAPGGNSIGSNLGVGYSVPGSNPWFVSIHADSWKNESYRIEVHSGDHGLTSPMLFANTVSPIGNESIILPKLDFSPPQPIKQSKSYSSSKIFGYANQTTLQKTWIYADYSTEPETIVSISIQIQGSNEWLDGYDTWIENSYRDSFLKWLNGDSHDGTLADGEFNEANGSYPDLTNPDWQRYIERSKPSG
ncbi:MAG TPA: hypothetical protein VMT57_02455 [Candidatus Thermoplasmatota archaeon]|nr:hypothetical protein [Candidatus Thermoplasmatota archaeon]